MKLLLDTHAFIWALLEPTRLSNRVRDALQDRDNQVFVSSVTFWEIALKASLGKLALEGCTPESLLDAAKIQGFDVLELDAATAASSSAMPRTAEHRDPFDRMLMWQATRGDMALVSRDRAILARESADLRVFW